MVNPYFNGNQNANEQNLLAGLLEEAIKMYGKDFYYLPETLINLDTFLGESSITEFHKAYIIEMYFNNYSGFGGSGNMFAPGGMFIFKEADYTVSIKRFNEMMQEIDPRAQQHRPQENAAIWNPFSKDLWIIKKVDHEKNFYPNGTPISWVLKTEKYIHSNEQFETGTEEVDNALEGYFNTNSTENDASEDNTKLNTDIDDIKNSSNSNPFGNP